MIKNLNNRRLLVIGMGVSGLSAARLIKSKGGEVIAASKGCPDTWSDYESVRKFLDEKNLFDQDDEQLNLELSSIDIVIKSPGVPWDIPLLGMVKSKGIKIWSEIELAFQFNKAPILAVTGTNGKTTTVSMIGEAARLQGVETFIGGNIGVPFCDLVFSEREVELVVLELSSFQLESMEDFHPRVAVILNLFENHAERYKNFEEYSEAKFHIMDCMDDDEIILFDANIKGINGHLKSHRCQKVAVDNSDLEGIYKELKEHFDLEHFKLKGDHNIINLYYAYKGLSFMGIREFTRGLQKMIETFEGVSYRLENNGKYNNIQFYNDSKSTNWEATAIALSSMKSRDRPLFLIIGGKCRGENDIPKKEMNDLINSKVDYLYLIGESGEVLYDKIGVQIPIKNLKTLDAVFDDIFENTNEGTVLFSPAFPSFDQYKSYIDRGEHFKKLLKVKGKL